MAASARHLRSCSSPSSSSSLFKKDADLLSRFVAFPRNARSSTWTYRPRRRSFQLKSSSNGSPLSAVFLQDGLLSIPMLFCLPRRLAFLQPYSFFGYFFLDQVEIRCPWRDSKLQGTKLPRVSYRNPKGRSPPSPLQWSELRGTSPRRRSFQLSSLFFMKNFSVFGYARTKLTDEELRNMIGQTLTCRIDKRENCEDKMEQFLKRCFYHSGQYNSEENFRELDVKLKEKEAGKLANRLFYLSIPPNIFVDVVRCASLGASSASGWTRVIVEKPFGRDSESSGQLTRCLMQYLAEDQIFRIDHYLGKELVENLSVLRFSNLVFEPLWSRNYIRNVQLIFSEDFGTDGRGGYFDNYGIIRDIMQNHLLQILALFAMETPVSLDAEDIRNEKVKVLRSMRPLRLEDVVVGQYKGHVKGGRSYPGYTDDPTVPKNSITPTFAAAALFINNARWDGVPFLMKAGKALYTKRAEIRVQFRHVPGNLYKRNFGTDLDKATNELVLRVQPDEAIYLKINNKVPGLEMRLDRSDLNLLYRARYPREIPDAYERLLLDAIEGERRLFIRSDELDAAWALFTPLLKDLEGKRIAPELYPYGSRGPVGAHYLAAKHNVRWGDIGTEE
ncbi:hypothetical protein SAY86_005020 [Trapa natans]|uniref:Glucose-6-phosphate 1-dehydrogenase n=1 Tax=Trapa natans TaxID=22666 RepID=A0AAN7L8C0_TRANT|nr:hypothetical protein SAY86_005020 [Trapa natans]